MTDYVVASGTTSAYVQLSFQDTEEVLAGGTAVRTEDGGTLTVSAGGYASNTLIDGGTETLYGVGDFDDVYDGTLSVEGPSALEVGASVQQGSDAYVDFGGVMSNVLDAGFIQVGSAGAGGKLVGATVFEDGFLTVYAGAVASDVVLQDGFVDDYGSTFGTVVSSGTAYIVYAGAYDSGTVISNGGLEYGDATVVRATVLSGGDLTLNPGFVASGDVVSNGGEADLAAVVSSGQTLTISGLRTSKDTVLSGVTVSSGGYLDLNAPVVQSGGVLSLAAGAEAFYVTVSAGGSLVGAGKIIGFDAAGYFDDDAGVVSGVSLGDLNDETDGNFGYLLVESGGLAASVRVYASSVVAISSGGSASGVQVVSGGALVLSAGAVASATTLQAGSVASGPGALAGDTTDIGLTVGVGVVSGTLSIRSGGSAVSTTVSSGGRETVLSGGVDSSGMVLSGAVLSLALGGDATGVTVQAGGVMSGQGQIVGSGNYDLGLVSGVALGHSAGLEVGSGGRAVAVTDVASGEVNLSVDSGGVVSGLVLSGAFSYGYVSAGGLISGLVLGSADYVHDDGLTVSSVASGGVEYAEDGGVASAAVIDAGAELFAFSGVAAGVTVNPGGLLLGFDGSVTGVTTISSGATISSEFGQFGVQSGAIEILYAGAIQTNVTVSAGARLELVSAVIASGATLAEGAVTASTTISGATLAVGATLLTSNAIVQSGGTATVSRAEAYGTTVSSGGMERLLAGGVASGGAVLAGGLLSGAGQILGTVSDHGRVVGPAVGRGGELEVFAGATAADVAVVAGGTLMDEGSVTDSRAGTALLAGTLTGSGRLVKVGAGLLVQSGTATGFTGSAVISGGTLELAASSGLGTGSLSFAATTGSAKLELLSPDQPATSGTFASTLSNFSLALDALDLNERSYVSGATATVSGTTLTFKDGGYVARFKLGGTVATSYTVASDGVGGTTIKPGADNPAAMTQAIAAFAPNASTSAILQAHRLMSARSTLGAESFAFRHALNR